MSRAVGAAGGVGCGPVGGRRVQPSCRGRSSGAGAPCVETETPTSRTGEGEVRAEPADCDVSCSCVPWQTYAESEWRTVCNRFRSEAVFGENGLSLLGSSVTVLRHVHP